MPEDQENTGGDAFLVPRAARGGETDAQAGLRRLPYDFVFDNRSNACLVRANGEAGAEALREKADTWLFLDDRHLARLIDLVREEMGDPKISKHAVLDAVDAAASWNVIDTFKDLYLDTLEWDGVKRLDDAFFYLFNPVEAHGWRGGYVMNHIIGSAVRRTYEPGWKCDISIALFGEANIGKSALGAKLLPDWGFTWFVDGLDLGKVLTKEMAERMAGAVIGEPGEMVGYSVSKIAYLKAWLTQTVDKWRFAYARTTSILPRKFILIATGNELKGLFSKDRGLIRRFFPVELEDSDGTQAVAWLEENRDQLWAEAVHQYKSGNPYEGIPRDVADAAQEMDDDDLWMPEGARLVRSLEDEDIVDHTPKQVLQACGYGDDPDGLRSNARLENEVWAALRQLGYKRKRARRDGGLVYVYVRGEEWKPWK